MKIGILTYHRSINNGAFIQCYSLFKKLSADFPKVTVEVIDYHMPIVDDKIYPVSIQQYFKYGSQTEKIKKAIRFIENPLMFQRQKEKNSRFEKALESLLMSTKRIYSNETEELFDYINSEYDMVVVGSDAIWNYSLRGFPNPYYLSVNVKRPKLSYAASCYGLSSTEVKDNEKEIIKQSLDSFEFLGVRDRESELFAKALGVTQETIHTCDPTVFLDFHTIPINRSEFENSLRDRGFRFDRETIGVMGNEDLCRFVKEKFGNRYQIVSLFNYSKYADVNLFDISPFEWAFIFRYFKLTVTTYFHGTLLSLKNSTPTVCVALNNVFNKNHISKVQDFLDRVDLKECYFTTNYKDASADSMILKMKELLDTSKFSSFIDRKMAEEAESYQIFRRRVERIVEEGKQK